MTVCIVTTPRQLRAWAHWLSLQSSALLLRGNTVRELDRVFHEIACLTATAAGAQPTTQN